MKTVKQILAEDRKWTEKDDAAHDEMFGDHPSDVRKYFVDKDFGRVDPKVAHLQFGDDYKAYVTKMRAHEQRGKDLLRGHRHETKMRTFQHKPSTDVSPKETLGSHFHTPHGAAFSMDNDFGNIEVNGTQLSLHPDSDVAHNGRQFKDPSDQWRGDFEDELERSMTPEQLALYRKMNK